MTDMRTPIKSHVSCSQIDYVWMFYDIDQIMNKEGHYVYSHCTDL